MLYFCRISSLFNLASQNITLIETLILLTQNILKPNIKYCLNFPGGPVTKNMSANAKDIGSIPGPGRCNVLRATQSGRPDCRGWAPRLDLQLRQPTRSSAHAPQEKPQQREAYASQPEKACMQQQRTAAAKNQSTNIKDLQTWVPTYKPLYKICFSTTAI